MNAVVIVDQETAIRRNAESFLCASEPEDVGSPMALMDQYKPVIYTTQSSTNNFGRHDTLPLLLLLLQMKRLKWCCRENAAGALYKIITTGEISTCQSQLWTNRNVFSWCLNGTREETVRRDGGRLFHARGEATGKARSPRVNLCTGGTTSVVAVEDRRWRRLSPAFHVGCQTNVLCEVCRRWSVEAAVCQNAETECYG